MLQQSPWLWTLFLYSVSMSFHIFIQESFKLKWSCWLCVIFIAHLIYFIPAHCFLVLLPLLFAPILRHISVRWENRMSERSTITSNILPSGLKLILELDVICVLRVVVLIVAVYFRVVCLVGVLYELRLLDEARQSLIPVGRDMTIMIVDIDTVDVLLYGFR